jgi:hypothetical protein
MLHTAQFGEAVVRAPLKVTLNKWTMKKMTDANAARHLKTAFDRHEEWGLALLLVHEFMHGAPLVSRTGVQG